MRYQPHEYQQQAIDFILTHPKAALILDMGLGKTVIALTAIWHLLYDSFEARRVLVVAPLRVARDTWPAEAAKWDHLEGLTMAVAVGTRQQRLDALAQNALVTVINRENLSWLVEQVGISWPWDMVVIDELSGFKNHNTKRFKALMRCRHLYQRIVGLTGTPAPNGLMDLWAQYKLLDNGERLGFGITKYRNHWFEPAKSSGLHVYSYRPRPGASQQIYDAISDITLSMKTCDYLQLPQLTSTTYPVLMPPSAHELYEQVAEDFFADLGPAGVVDVKNAGVLVGKLTQIASGAFYLDREEDCAQSPWMAVHDCKLDALEDLFEAANGQPLLVAYWWQHDLERIQARFRNARQLRTSKDFQAWNAGENTARLDSPSQRGARAEPTGWWASAGLVFNPMEP